MSAFIAALPMYDWPETRAETDAQWAGWRDRLRAAGYDASDRLVRRNGDMPAVPGGIRDRAGCVIAPDPAALDPDAFDFATLWRHPQLLFAQTCWGPLEQTGLSKHVRVVAQPDYSAFEGGQGIFYRSAIVMRRGEGTDVAAPEEERPLLPVDLMAGRRFGFNEAHSLSGIIALRRDLAALGAIADEAAFGDFWSQMTETGGHRASIVAVAEGRADVAAIDCRTLDLARRFEPAMAALGVVGWTGLRKGLPYIASAGLDSSKIDMVTIG